MIKKNLCTQNNYKNFQKKQKMKKTIFFLAWICLATYAGNAQETNFCKSLRLGYTYIGGAVVIGFTPPTDDILNIVSGHELTLDADLFQVFDNLTAGAYISICEASTRDVADSPTTIASSPAIGTHYGISLRYHLLPEADKWDITLGGTVGAYFSKHLTPQKEYGLSASVTYYPLKHIGVFGEAGWGSYLFGSSKEPAMVSGNSMLKAGISYRF